MRKLLLLCGGLVLGTCCYFRAFPSAASNAVEPKSEIAPPTTAPQFSPFDFCYANVDPLNPERVLLQRTAFTAEQRSTDVEVTRYRTETRTRQATDANGNEDSVTDVVQVPYIETQTKTFTVHVLTGKETSSCPIDSLLAFDVRGEKLDTSQVRLALSRGCRVVVQPVGSANDPFYGSFLRPDAMYVQSDRWIKEPN